MLIVESQSLDVYRNLAIEEYLMGQEGALGPVLFLCRNASAVVVGKNQNPWMECRLDRMAEDEVPLARRMSGGGTVYHDVGNLNFCVITDRTSYSKELAYTLVLEALRTCGIEAQRSGKSNIVHHEHKFSGNAFCFRRGRALHHGTLLLDADLERLRRYLGPVCDGIQTKAIASEPVPVTNLQLEVQRVTDALIDTFMRLYNEGPLDRKSDDDIDPHELESILVRQRSEAWIYGNTPRFYIQFKESKLTVEKGVVVAVEGPHAEWIGRSFSEIAFNVS